MRNVLVYRDSLLPISETFIQNQVDQLTRYRAFYGGLWRAKPSLTLNRDAVVLNQTTGWRSSLRLSLYERLGVAPAFFACIRCWDIKLIHAHFAPDGTRAIRLAKALQVPLLVTLHGYDVTMRGLFHHSYSELWRTATKFLCVSEFIRNAALEVGFPEEKLLVHYIGVNQNTFQPSDEQKQAESKAVLFVGRLVEKKGCEYLIRAMKQVQSVEPEATLTVVGTGPLHGSLQELATRLGVRCEFTGAQDQRAIRQRMRQAAVFCVPSIEASHGDSEGFGIVFIEAQAVGTPVVSFRHGGIPEAVLDGVTGQLVPERDEAALAASLLFYLQDTRARQFAGRAARDFVLQRYDLKRQTQLLEDVYDSVLESPRNT